MLLDTLGTIFLGNMLFGKGVIRAREGTAKVGYGSKDLQPRNLHLKNFDSTTFVNKF